MSDKKQQPKIEKTAPSKRGGTRSGAGRPTIFTLQEKMALALRVAEVREQHKCSALKAVEIMLANGELPAQSDSNITRYLTPEYLNPAIAEPLKDVPDRQGIIAAIPMPQKTRTKKSKV